MAKFDGGAVQPVIDCMDAIHTAATIAVKGDSDEHRMLMLSACALLLRLALDDDPEDTEAVINNAFATSGWRLVMEN